MDSVPARFITVDAENAIHVIHQRPDEGKNTFVFLNSMGATTDVWEQTIAPDLRRQGFGTLSFDYRGQGETRFGADATLEPDEIIADILRVFAHEQPSRAIMCGLSIGGLFAAHAWHKGAKAEAIVFVNTLRKPTPQVEWINTLRPASSQWEGCRWYMTFYDQCSQATPNWSCCDRRICPAKATPPGQKSTRVDAWPTA